MNWLITGGCGFIGTSLIGRILSDTPEANIRVLDNLSVGKQSDLERVCRFTECAPTGFSKFTGVQLFVADIRDTVACHSAVIDIDCIVHLAGNTGVGPSVEAPRLDMESNVVGVFNMLEAARMHNVNRFVFASSGAPAGIVEPPIHEEMAPHPVSPYGASKLAGEGYCSAYFHSYGINTVSLRFGNVYGPGSGHKTSVVAKFIKSALDGEVCEVYGDGNQTRDFIYIDDLVDAVIKASQLGRGGEIFQIATSSETTLNELIELLEKVFGENGLAAPRIEYGARRVGDVKRNFSDTSKAREILGWTAIHNLEEGLSRTLDYFTQNNIEKR